MPPQPKWYLDTSNINYRTIRAQAKISRFELIEDSAVTSLALFESQRNKFCASCLKESAALSKCSECSIFYYCNSECQKQDWLQFHKNECPLLHKLPYRESTDELILTMRVYGIYKENECFRTQMLKMKSHGNSYSEANTLQMKETAKKVVEILKEPASQINVVFEILCKIKINSFTIEKLSFVNGLAIGTGFYEGQFNYLNHSCLPNCFKIFNGTKMRLFAAKDINVGEEILICYDEILGKAYHKRQKHIKEIYHFVCECTLCVKEKVQSDLYPNISMLCQKCPQKGLISNNTCQKCLTAYKNEQLAQMHSELEESIESALKNKSFEEILTFLEDLKGNKLEFSSYLIEFLMGQTITKYLHPLFNSHTRSLYKMLKTYIKNYKNWFEIQFPSLGFKYNELSKLALILKKGKKAKVFCEEAWKMLCHYLTEDKPEMIELKQRIKMVDALLDMGNEVKKTANSEVLRID